MLSIYENGVLVRVVKNGESGEDLMEDVLWVYDRFLIEDLKAQAEWLETSRTLH